MNAKWSDLQGLALVGLLPVGDKGWDTSRAHPFSMAAQCCWSHVILSYFNLFVHDLSGGLFQRLAVKAASLHTCPYKKRDGDILRTFFTLLQKKKKITGKKEVHSLSALWECNRQYNQWVPFSLVAISTSTHNSGAFYSVKIAFRLVNISSREKKVRVYWNQDTRKLCLWSTFKQKNPTQQSWCTQPGGESHQPFQLVLTVVYVYTFVKGLKKYPNDTNRLTKTPPGVLPGFNPHLNIKSGGGRNGEIKLVGH